MNDLGWFVRICDWEFDNLEDLEPLDMGLWQAIVAHLKGWDKP